MNTTKEYDFYAFIRSDGRICLIVNDDDVKIVDRGCELRPNLRIGYVDESNPTLVVYDGSYFMNIYPGISYDVVEIEPADIYWVCPSGEELGELPRKEPPTVSLWYDENWNQWYLSDYRYGYAEASSTVTKLPCSEVNIIPDKNLSVTVADNLETVTIGYETGGDPITVERGYYMIQLLPDHTLHVRNQYDTLIDKVLLSLNVPDLIGHIGFISSSDENWKPLTGWGSTVFESANMKGVYGILIAPDYPLPLYTSSRTRDAIRTILDYEYGMLRIERKPSKYVDPITPDTKV